MEERKQLIEAGKQLLGSGMTVETWGNISVRDAQGNVYITPSGMDYFSCTEDDIVMLSPDGQILQGNRKPSTEAPLHLAIYRTRPDVGAVLHTHPIYSTIFACTGREIPLFLDEAAQVLTDTVRICPYALPGSDQLAEQTAQALQAGANACLLQAHGAVCVGKDLKEAFKVAKVLEMTAEIYWRTLAIGMEPGALPQEVIETQRDFVAHQYGQPKV